MAWVEMDSVESATNAVATIHNSNLYTLVSKLKALTYSLENYSVFPLQRMAISDFRFVKKQVITHDYTNRQLGA